MLILGSVLNLTIFSSISGEAFGLSVINLNTGFSVQMNAVSDFESKNQSILTLIGGNFDPATKEAAQLAYHVAMKIKENLRKKEIKLYCSSFTENLLFLRWWQLFCR